LRSGFSVGTRDKLVAAAAVATGGAAAAATDTLGVGGEGVRGAVTQSAGVKIGVPRLCQFTSRNIAIEAIPWRGQADVVARSTVGAIESVSKQLPQRTESKGTALSPAASARPTSAGPSAG